jgi:hypothetical protein
VIKSLLLGLALMFLIPSVSQAYYGRHRYYDYYSSVPYVYPYVYYRPYYRYYSPYPYPYRYYRPYGYGYGY